MCLFSTPKAIPTVRKLVHTTRVANHISYCELYDEKHQTKSSSFIIVIIPLICGAIGLVYVSMLVQSVQVRTPTRSTARLYEEKITYPCYFFVFKGCTGTDGITQERTRNQLIRTWRLSRVCASPSRPPPTRQLCSSSPFKLVLFS